jgi:hypothetical protein
MLSSKYDIFSEKGFFDLLLFSESNSDRTPVTFHIKLGTLDLIKHPSIHFCFCSVHHRFHHGSGAHSASYPMGTRGSFPGVKWPRREADHSSPPSAEVKNAWSYISTPQYAFITCCLVKHRDNFTFTFTFTLVHFKTLN